MGDEYLAFAEEDHADVVRRELLLLNPAVRSDPHRVRELLHPDFLEFGASGRSWDLEAIVEALAIDPSSPSQEPTELAPVHVADDVVLLTYHIDGQYGASLRSSLWVGAMLVHGVAVPSGHSGAIGKVG